MLGLFRRAGVYPFKESFDARNMRVECLSVELIGICDSLVPVGVVGPWERVGDREFDRPSEKFIRIRLCAAVDEFVACVFRYDLTANEAELHSSMGAIDFDAISIYSKRSLE